MSEYKFTAQDMKDKGLEFYVSGKCPECDDNGLLFTKTDSDIYLCARCGKEFHDSQVTHFRDMKLA